MSGSDTRSGGAKCPAICAAVSRLFGFIVLGLVTGLNCAYCASPGTAARTRPHILFILADELRADCLGSYGNVQVRTPHLDSLAAESVRFNNFYCAFPVCTPSRYSILSGLPVHEHRGWNNHCTLPPDVATFPGLLRQAGYRTKAVGKMHFAPTYADFGLSELVLAEQDGPGRWDDDYHRYLRRLGLVDAIDLQDQVSEFRSKAGPDYWESFGAQVSNLDERHQSTTWIGDRAVETLRNWDPARPSLLVVGFIKPHHPFDPPANWARKYDPGKTAVLPGWTSEPLPQDLALGKGYFDAQTLTAPGIQKCTAFYYATISQLDYQVGRMLDVLKGKGLYESTLILFTADHGEYLGFHHLLLKGNHMYDPLARVPLLIHFPGHRRAGSANDALVSNIDLAPTILRAAGLVPPPAMQGRDLSQPGAGRDIVFCETRDEVMARTATHKLLWRPRPERRLFFDLKTDPLELTNRLGDPQFADEVGRLTRAVEAWRPAKLSPAHLDETAPQVTRQSVPTPEQRREEIQWYREQTEKWQARPHGP